MWNRFLDTGNDQGKVVDMQQRQMKIDIWRWELGGSKINMPLFFNTKFTQLLAPQFQQKLFETNNGAPTTSVWKNDLVTLWKITQWNARNSQQLFRVEKT